MADRYDAWEWVGMGVCCLFVGLGIGGCNYLSAKARAIDADTDAKVKQVLMSITNSFNHIEITPVKKP